MSSFVELVNAQKHFRISKGIIRRQHRYIRAVDDVSLSITKGEVFGLVGESGSGKTTVARLIPRLINLTGGSITFNGQSVSKLSRGELNKFRRRIGMVFQDPASSLNPRSTVKESVLRPLQLNNVSSKVAEERLKETADLVGLSRDLLNRHPHELSGGQQQRASVARAIILRPELIILDEPTSALDVSVQAQILNLLVELQEQLGLTYLFISHNLTVVRYLSDRVGVMYLGKLMEVATAEELYSKPLHPYSLALLSASPPPNPRFRKREKFILIGDPPSLISPPTGCRLHPRCAFADERCHTEEPALRDVVPNCSVACHRADELNLSLYL